MLADGSVIAGHHSRGSEFLDQDPREGLLGAIHPLAQGLHHETGAVAVDH
jgi:hypothetical protein